MIILNKNNLKSNNGSNSSIYIDDLNNYNTSNTYYKAIWKHKYNISIDTGEAGFEKNLIKYLKGVKSFIE